ncbi:MAG: GNAT family N-acetyltransferase [Brevundimonas sp.]
MRSEPLENLSVRRAQPSDIDRVLELARRVHESGVPPWRDPALLTRHDQKVISSAVAGMADVPLVLVATQRQAPVGFIHLCELVDYYAERPHGHVVDLAVDAACQGRGVGRRLLEAAEAWARYRGYPWLTLSVFETNTRARTLYERSGFGTDMVRMVRNLGAQEPLGPSLPPLGARRRA